jgi:transposase-like protein
MDKVHVLSMREVFALYPDQESARRYLEGRRWPNGVLCPICGSGERVTARKDGYYRCNGCEDFTVRTGTVFERSHVPLHKWLHAMYLLVTARKGISSLQLSKEISVTQKSAWFVLHRLREACSSELEQLQGIVEVDEVYIGGKESVKHARKKLKAGRGSVGKIPVLGMRQRGGKTVAKVIHATDEASVRAALFEHVEPGSELHTDEAAVYRSTHGVTWSHKSVNHSAGEYVRGNVHTNGIDSVWAVLRRGLHGVYHQCSKKHLNRYVQEFSFRLGDGNCKRSTMDRLNSFVDGTIGKRLTYKDLTHAETPKPIGHDRGHGAEPSAQDQETRPQADEGQQRLW